MPCASCGRRAGHVRSGASLCTRCVRESAPAPLHTWREAAGLSVDEVAEATGVSVRAVKMALAGQPVGLRVAMRLNALTGIELAELLAGVDVT